jgi:hypothetical protein
MVIFWRRVFKVYRCYRELDYGRLNAARAAFSLAWTLRGM